MRHRDRPFGNLVGACGSRHLQTSLLIEQSCLPRVVQHAPAVLDSVLDSVLAGPYF